MKIADVEKAKTLLDMQKRIEEVLQEKYVGVAFGGESLYSLCYPRSIIGEDERLEELLREALTQRLCEIRDELKELGLED